MRVRERDERAVAAVAAWLRVPWPDGVQPDLAALAEAVGRAAGAQGCWLRVAGRRYGWGADGPSWSTPVDHGGKAQGTLGLVPESAGPLQETAAVLGPVLSAARLREETDALRRAGDTATRDLADARWRAAAEMDRERRTLERDLHDGAQHQLVALKLSVALLEHVLSSGQTDLSRTAIDDLMAKLDDAEDLVVRTAAGILPIALVSQGLGAALAAELTGHADVTLDLGGGLRRYPPVAESAVYFICMEAVNNAHKHAPGAAITVSLRDTGPTLEFTVTDTGPGFADLPPDAGLHNLSTRATAVGGTARVHSTPGRGTTVTGAVPTGPA
ncbi:sensor histidine kinase [Actinokineospora guangxiensis]|uniref:histidine kinase n=1 Tax=Actinokineospora guangxiensis TaxID=1490288 RepID=A0ABW0EJH1_9PSEU